MGPGSALSGRRLGICWAAALELLVSNSVTGMPVLDDDGTVVGVVSDYDLLSLEGIAEPALVGSPSTRF